MAFGNSDPHGDNDERHFGGSGSGSSPTGNGTSNGWSNGNGTQPRDGSASNPSNPSSPITRPGNVSTPGSNPTTHTGAGYQSPAGSPSQNTSTQGSSPAVNPRDDQLSEQQSLRHSPGSPYDEYGLTESDWESINESLEDSEDDDNDDDDDEDDDTDDTNPILLDLDGNGVGITELSRSSQFRDAGGDGLLHRTAWAAAGDGVLFYDVGQDGLINEKREYVFTEWDPTATSDLKALRAAFDTNGDGRLTAADAGFSQFKVLVTKPDGSTEAKTLSELGITEINLEGDATEITLPDGSRITAQTTFTRSNGSTGTVADTVLMAAADGHHVVQTASSDGAGTRTVDTKAHDAGGALAYAITSVTSADGLSITNSYDDNGDGRGATCAAWQKAPVELFERRARRAASRGAGRVDRLQTVTAVVNGDGSRTETLTNKLGNTAATAVLADRTVTTTSADGKSVTIQRDTTGGGWLVRARSDLATSKRNQMRRREPIKKKLQNTDFISIRSCAFTSKLPAGIDRCQRATNQTA